ncbi:MAG: HAMP domain-containing protein [Candidatus Methanoperedens sp.]|nr:HAMP domain-containing protein [Candidatus Methanoperedens sp.]
MNNLSITQKLVIALIIISLIPYAVISYMNYSAEKNALEKNVFEDLSALAEAKSTHISTVINFRISQVKEISSSNFMQEIEHQTDKNLILNLRRVKKEIPEFLEISALDLQGRVVASTDSALMNKNYSEEDHFNKAREKTYLGNIEFYDNRTGYMISSPVLNRTTGKLIGVLAVRVYPLFIYDVTSDYTGLGKSGESLLVHKRDNEIVYLNPLRYDPDAALRLRFLLDSERAQPAILAAKGENGTIRALDYRGIEVFAAYTYSRKVAKGYLSVEIQPESRDEIGELARSFNVMVKKLKESYEDLEQKVKERTGDLIRRNLELAALIKTNQSISAGLDLSRVLEIAVREAVRTVNVSYCSIILIEEGNEYGSIASEYSPEDNLKPSIGERLYLEDCPTLKEAYHGRQYIMIADTRNVELSPKARSSIKKRSISARQLQTRL